MKPEDLTGIPFLSCVEHYFLAWLKKTEDIRPLFVGSFAEAEAVARYFAAGGTYAAYDGIERLQDLSERLGVTAHCRSGSPPRGDEPLALMRVNLSFFTGALLPWREDHFVAVERCGERFRFINQYPLSEGVLTEAELKERFGGVSLFFRMCGAPDRRVYAAERERALERMRKTPDMRGMDALEGRALRDAVGVLRVSRARVLQWLSAEGYGAPSSLREEIDLLDALYFRLEAARLRNKSVRFSEAERFAALETEWRRNPG